MAIITSIDFPFRSGTLAFPKVAEDFDAIKASIIQIITTMPGERVMRPTFGCNAFGFVFENDTNAFRMLVEREVRTSLVRWEPRINILGIDIETDPATQPGQVVITIHYSVINTNFGDSVTLAGGL
jgi:phage baseplate assembly protein W